MTPTPAPGWHFRGWSLRGMIRNLSNRIIAIVFVLAFALWIDLSPQIEVLNPLDGNALFIRDVSPRLGLDLQGGLQVLLEADLPEDSPVDANAMETARQIVQQRTDALGVNENVIQLAGDRRIVGEFPGLEDTESVLATIQQTGLLEFVDTGDFSLDPGTIIATDYSPGDNAPGEVPPSEDSTEDTVYHTVMTGGDLDSVIVRTDAIGTGYEIDFTLTPNGSEIFASHTSANVGKFLTIVLDKLVISSPSIGSAITGGQGTISGNFSLESANSLAIQLRYGSLPVPLKIVETRIIGPTLGADSLQKSLVAGLIGMTIVAMFMILYYRLPGIVAVLSILFYAAIALALFKWFHFTLTLPGIAGFLLSTGAALDAIVLIFERLKEELRNGKILSQAVDQGWTRAWSSIRDSNLSTIITSGILFWFGSTFGATIVKGFSLTLALGVAISLFTAIYVTRTLLVLFLRTFKPQNLTLWFGI
ncbi:MAG: protein translocase subunit SecD [Chloroflexi bacterium]|nr:protein translocase subunit SecD [Chloroflexota bacterium]